MVFRSIYKCNINSSHQCSSVATRVGSTKAVVSLEKDLALTVIRNRQISELQDNVLQSLTIALYSTDEKSSAYNSLNAALSDSKEVASLLRSKDFLDSEDFVRSGENNFTAESE